MKAIIALLLGISAYVNADEYSFDSNENEAGDDTSYNGFVFTVNDGDDSTSPRIRFQSSLNDHESTYCFDLIGLFESDDYPLDISTDPSYSITANTEITFDDNQCNLDTATITSTHFDIECAVGSNGASLIASFDFIADNVDADGNDGLEYSLTLSDYTLTSNTSKLIFVQKMTDCSDAYSYSADSDETVMQTTEDPTRRRLVDVTDSGETVSDSADEADGVSSDESDEIDVGIAQWLKTGEAHDICYNDINNPTDVASNDIISSNVVFITDDSEIHIVIDSFDCVLQIDPWIGYDKTKIVGNDGDSAAPNDFANAIVTLVMMALLILFL